jgi:pimeloyl-ACP methyl ester carboxylesterase
MRWPFHIAAIVTIVAVAGCATPFGPQAQNGITFYCPGVGNVDMGDAGLREGLQKAGYRGEVSRLTWSYTFNPIVDQTVQPIARLGAARLAGYIQEYIDQYPGREVNVVGLSAGSGVAIWALEALRPEYKVNNVVLLSGSLSSDYDAGAALQHVRGEIYNYYSPHDAVLTQLMKVACTIDGKIAADGAGAVGLHSPHGAERVVNVEWRPEFERYGYNGGHGDSTSPAFVQAYISRHIVTARPVALRRTTAASLVATAPPGGHRD